MKKLLIALTLIVGGVIAYKKNAKIKGKVDELIGMFKKGVKKGHELMEKKEEADETEASTA